MSKPKGEKCDTCFVKNNRLRCSLCKWKTEEWFWNQPPAPITISGDEDLYVERKEKLQLSPETSTNDEEIIIKTGQTYGKSANISKDSICEQIKKHAERIKAEADKNPDSLWAKGMRSFDVLDDSTTSKTETVDTDLISRQAAIEEIKNATTITGWNKYASQEEIVDDVERQLRRLFVGAIESLPPVEPPKKVEPKTDLVNRSDVLELVKSGALISVEKYENYKKMCKAINGLPSCHTCRECEPERPKGEWIEVEGYNGDIHYQCNQCGDEFILIDGTPEDNNYLYCPNCGAYMRGDKE